MSVLADLRQRSTEPELLDQGVPADEALRSLADLRFVNRWLGGRRSLRRALGEILDASDRPRLLDVGCGSADLPALLARERPGLLAIGLDVKRLHLEAAPATVRRVLADVRRLPFRAQSFDVVTASLFLHHFDEAQLPELLRSLFALTRKALVVNDLRRARVPHLFARLVFPWIFQSRVSVQDGLTSIRRGFTPAELRTAFDAAGLDGVEIRRVFPYRLIAVAVR